MSVYYIPKILQNIAARVTQFLSTESTAVTKWFGIELITVVGSIEILTFWSFNELRRNILNELKQTPEADI